MVTPRALSAALGKAAHQQILDEANELGSAVHARIEWRLKGELGVKVGEKPPLDGLALAAYRAWVRWREKVVLKPIFVEQLVWSHVYGYSGTMDLFCEMVLPGIGRALCLPDWKTSKRIWGEAGIQNASYVEALVQMGHAKHPIYGVVLRIPKFGDPADECEMKVYGPETQTARFRVFLAAMMIFAWQEEEEKAMKPAVLPEPQRPVLTGEEFTF